MKIFSRLILVAICLLIIAGFTYYALETRMFAAPRTVQDVLDQYGDAARARLKPKFESLGLNYPPPSIALLAIKDEAKMEVWTYAKDSGRKPILIHTYPIKRLSGVSGPKLREGDKQVPEGFYQIIAFNPNSSFHLSLKLNYPNAFDLKHANSEGRLEPGSDIFIHGKARSVGCLAMGDPAIEELFILTADVGRSNVKVMIAPTDPRANKLDASVYPEWVRGLYEDLTQSFKQFPHEEIDHPFNDLANYEWGIQQLRTKTPIQFLETLRLSKPVDPNQQLVGASLIRFNGWVREQDVSKLMEHIHSQEPAAPIVSPLSSILPEGPSTIGNEAAFMIMGYKVGSYPPDLLSTYPLQDIAEIELWWEAKSEWLRLYAAKSSN